MASVILDISDFRALYPAFSDEELYPDINITTAFDTATLYKSNESSKCVSIDRLRTMLYLLTAHILFVNQKANNGDQSGLLASATVDKVSVSMQTTSKNNAFHYWLNQSPYGQQYLALSRLCLLGGVYVGGSPEMIAYPKARFW